MTARCISCGNSYFFRNQRGNRLKDHKCQCGGSYEIMASAKMVTIDAEKCPPEYLPQLSKDCELGDGRVIVFPDKNRAGKLFLYIRDTKKYIPFEP